MPDMRISDVIKRLEELKQQYGDLICSTQEDTVSHVDLAFQHGNEPKRVMIAGE